MTLGEARIAIRANLGPLRTGLRQARRMLGKGLTGIARSAMRSVTRMISSVMHSIMRTIRRIAKIITVSLIAAVTASAVAWAKFQKQVAMVNTMLTTKTMPMITSFAAGLRQLAKESGQATATLAKGLFDILSASVDASKAMDVLKVSVKAAVAGMTEAGIAADLITTILNSYQMSAEKAGEISDKLFATVKRGKTTFPELAQSLGMVTATAALAGLGLDELLAITSTLTRGGIKTSRAVFAINNALRAFLSPQNEAKDMAKKFGVVLSTNTLKTDGLVKSISKLNKATAEQLAVIFPNIRGFKAIAGALQDLTGLTKDYTLISVKSAGETEVAYAKMADTVSFDFGVMTEKIRDSGVAFGKAIGPLTQKMMKGIGDSTEKLTELITEYEQAIKDFGNTAFENIKQKVVGYFEELLGIVQDQGWHAALSKLGMNIKEAMTLAWTSIEPFAIRAGELIAQGFWVAFKAGAKGIGGAWAGRVADPVGITELLTGGLTGGGLRSMHAQFKADQTAIRMEGVLERALGRQRMQGLIDQNM